MEIEKTVFICLFILISIFAQNLMMNQSKIFLTTLALFFLSIAAAQSQKKFSIEVSYPLRVSKSFENFNGVIAAGVKYNFKETSTLILGVSYNIEYFAGSFRFHNQDNNISGLFHHFNMASEFKLASLEKLHFMASAGYSLWVRKNKFSINNTAFPTNGEQHFSSNGFNIQLGASYDFAKSFYAKACFRYIGIYEENYAYDTIEMINYNTINIGIGFRFL